MAQTNAERFISAIERLETEGDVDGMVALFAADAEIHNPVDGRRHRGRAGAREFWEAYRRTFREVHSDFRGVVESDDTAMLEWVTHGRSPRGGEFQVCGVSVVEFADGRIRGFRAYFDPRELAAELLDGR